MTKQFLFILTLVLFLSSCGNDTPKPEAPPTSLEENTPPAPKVEEPPAKVNYTYETIGSENGWGYSILQNGEPFIRQPNIPSLPGNQGFDSEEKAIKVAEYILDKLNNGVMPPSVNKEELESLGVL